MLLETLQKFLNPWLFGLALASLVGTFGGIVALAIVILSSPALELLDDLHQGIFFWELIDFEVTYEIVNRRRAYVGMLENVVFLDLFVSLLLLVELNFTDLAKLLGLTVFSLSLVVIVHLHGFIELLWVCAHFNITVEN